MLALYGPCTEFHAYQNIAKYTLPIMTYYSVTISFWSLAQSSEREISIKDGFWNIIQIQTIPFVRL